MGGDFSKVPLLMYSVDGAKGGVHVPTPYPEKSKKLVQKSGGSVSCNRCGSFHFGSSE